MSGMRGGVSVCARMVASALVACVIASCGAPSPTARPTPAATPTPTPTLTPTPTAVPTIRAFPTTSNVALSVGRYDAAPPFAINFSFEIPDDGWYSAHVHEDFFDVIRFDGADSHDPTRWVAWALPATIYGTSDTSAVGLTPDDAAAAVSTNSLLTAGAARPFSFAGLVGVQMDIHAPQPLAPVFGSSEGAFRLDPLHDLRLGLVTVDNRLMLVMCLGPVGQLDEACADARPILDSVEL